jgi:PhnB protein
MTTTKVSAVPAGYHSVTPYFTMNDAGRAIDFYKSVFGAEEHLRMPGPGGKISHAEIKIGDSIVMLADEMPDMYSKSPKTVGATTGGGMLYVEDCDAVFKRAVDAGATVMMPLTDMFWGDRYGQVKDPFGHLWSIATHKEDVSPEEMQKRQEAFFAQMGQQK